MALNCNNLHATLAAENEALLTFIETLRQEQQVLLKGKTDHLGLFAEQKAQSILELTTWGEQRLQLLRHCGMTPNRAGMEQLLNEHYAGDGSEAEQWEQLLRLATAANQINSSNGMLISARMKYTQRALNTLFSVARLPAAYASDGSTV
ncbi:MAG: flagellar protein FlgN, partial [Burkholderiales bacterium]